MDFPFKEVFDGLGLIIIVILFLFSPAIVGSLIGQIGKLFRNIFSKGDEDE